MQNPVAPVQAWWLRAIDGVVAILFGLAALLWPGITLVVLVLLFGVYALVSGFVSLVAMFRAFGTGGTWWTHLLMGVAGIGAGAAVFAWPLLTGVTLLYIIAFWAIIIGVIEVVMGLVTTSWWPALVGVLSVVFGFILLSNPAAGALAFILVIGVFAIIRGVVEIVGAIREPAGTGAAG